MTKEEFLSKQNDEARAKEGGTKSVWITVNELQAKLKISRSTVYRWVSRGALRAYRFDGARNIYFLNDEVDHFLSLNPIAPSGRLDKIGLMIYGQEN